MRTKAIMFLHHELSLAILKTHSRKHLRLSNSSPAIFATKRLKQNETIGLFSIILQNWYEQSGLLIILNLYYKVPILVHCFL